MTPSRPPFDRHVPVLLAEAVAALSPGAEGRYLDATFGAGGYSRALLATPGAQVLALDRDPTAVRGGAPLVQEAQGRLRLIEARFSELEKVAARENFLPLQGVVFDIGVSSMQLDEPDRGFSFRDDGPRRRGADRRGDRQHGLRGKARRHLPLLRRRARRAAHRPRDRA
jgi:16S rRNA (cytosine1402-N4)-methyltransferase